jgi:DNA-binding transcriptional LysR family regulator
MNSRNESSKLRVLRQRLFNAEAIAVRPVPVASNTLALIGLVAEGLGVTIYPESLIGFLGRSADACPINHPGFRSRNILVWRKNRRSALADAFVASARRC